MKKSTVKKIVISAAYGMGNLGDEAICETIVNDIHSVGTMLDITVLVFNKSLFLKAHPNLISKKNIRIRSMDFRRGVLLSPRKMIDLVLGMIAVALCDVFIWGGGNLIRNKNYWLNIYIKPLMLAQTLSKQIIVWSIGIDAISKPEVIKLINKIRIVSFFSVRDKASKDNLLSISTHFNEEEIRVVRDPVFHFSQVAKATHTHNAKKVGFNITFWKADFSHVSDIEKFTASFAKILNALCKKTGAKLVYLPSAPERDHAMYELLLKKLDPMIDFEYPEISTPTQYIDHLSGLDIFIGMRMHSIIMASNVRDLPLFGIIYDEKVQALSNEGGLNRIFSSIGDVIDHPESVEEKITNTLNGLLRVIDFSDMRQDSRKTLATLGKYFMHE